MRSDGALPRWMGCNAICSQEVESLAPQRLTAAQINRKLRWWGRGWGGGGHQSGPPASSFIPALLLKSNQTHRSRISFRLNLETNSPLVISLFVCFFTRLSLFCFLSF